MDKSHSGRQHIDPRLLALIDKAEGEESLDLKSLRKGDVVSVQTRNTVYTMKVLDPENGKVLVNSDGHHVAQETNGTVLAQPLLVQAQW